MQMTSIPHPSKPDAMVTIKRVGWRALRRAQAVSQQESAKSLMAMGGAAFAKEFQELGEASTRVVRAADPLWTHDLWTVLVAGLVGWTEEEIDDLDPGDAESLGRSILAYSGVRTETPADVGNA